MRLNFGSRSISFQPVFRDALEFALNTPAYRVAEIIGVLEDDEKRAFIERLMQEGLVVRKDPPQPS